MGQILVFQVVKDQCIQEFAEEEKGKNIYSKLKYDSAESHNQSSSEQIMTDLKFENYFIKPCKKHRIIQLFGLMIIDMRKE